MKHHNPLTLTLLALASFIMPGIAQAGSDLEAQQGVAQARARSNDQDMDHSAHRNANDPRYIYRGVFYGYLPCSDCDGIKNTLSLKHKNNYLLVVQYARQSSRETFEKGKYQWDEDKKLVTLTPNKEDVAPRYYRIKDEATLIQLNADGSMPKNTSGYQLQRSDTYQSREVHIH